MTTSLGLSAGSGMIHCVLLTTDEAGRTHSVNRVIDVDRTDGLTRAGRVNSGIDLMLGQARDAAAPVGPIGVAYRTDEQAREIASRGTGAKRQIHLVAETEAIAHHLISAGEINRFESVVVVDLGDTGMSLYTIDPATRHIGDHRRSTALSGNALDALLAAELTNSGRIRGRRKSSITSACRTAKEELSARESTTLAAGNPAVPVAVTKTMLERLVRPMASAAADEIAEYVGTERESRPEAIVLVGGLANIPLVRDLITERSGLEPVTPHAPESVAATGAAMLAGVGAASTLAFIGGRRSRDWLSAAPLAVFGALLAGALMTVYAVGSSLAGNPSTPSSPPSSVTVDAEQTTVAAPPAVTSESRSTPTVTSPQQVSVTAAPPPTTMTNNGGTGGGNQDPGWATTELPAPSGPTEQPSTSTLTTSLWPFPIPSITWPPGLGQLPSAPQDPTTIVPPPVTSPPPATTAPAPAPSVEIAPASPAPQQQSVPTTPPAG